SILREVTYIFHDPGTQWMIFLCLGIYFTGFIFLRCRTKCFWREANPQLWLIFLLLINAVFYAINHLTSAQALILLGGAALGQGVAMWAGIEVKNAKLKITNDFSLLAVSLLVVLLALASVWNGDLDHSFQYRSRARLTGPWDNPNVYGLLMGTGSLLAAGMGIRGWRMDPPLLRDRSGAARGRRWRKILFLFLCFVAASLLGRGLL